MKEFERSDEEIVLLVKGGDKKAFEILVDRYLDKIKRYAKRLIFDRGDIDDLVQDVFVKTYINIQSFDDTKKFSSWIYRIAHNQFINAIRQKMYERLFRVEFDTFFPHPFAKEESDQDTERDFLKKTLEDNLSKMKEKYREALVLYFFEDMDYKEIAEVLEIPVSTVGIRIKRGKEILKELIKNKI